MRGLGRRPLARDALARPPSLSRRSASSRSARIIWASSAGTASGAHLDDHAVRQLARRRRLQVTIVATPADEAIRHRADVSPSTSSGAERRRRARDEPAESSRRRGSRAGAPDPSSRGGSTWSWSAVRSSPAPAGGPATRVRNPPASVRRSRRLDQLVRLLHRPDDPECSDDRALLGAERSGKFDGSRNANGATSTFAGLEPTRRPGRDGQRTPMHDEQSRLRRSPHVNMKVTGGRVFGRENHPTHDLGRGTSSSYTSLGSRECPPLELAPVARGEGIHPAQPDVVRERRPASAAQDRSSAAEWCSLLPRQMKTWS